MATWRRWTAAAVVNALTAALVVLGCKAEQEKPASPPAATQPPTAGVDPAGSTRAETGPPPAAQPAPADLPPGEDWQAGQPYVVRRAAGAVTIDQVPHPEQWRHAMLIRDFKVPITLRLAKSRTEARMLWDDQHLYVHLLARDEDLRAKFTQRTDPLWNEDVVELFLKPYADKPGYYELEVNPINTVMTLEIQDRKDKQGLKERSQWETGIRSAVQVMGTVNDPADRDQFYRVVMAIPWKNLRLLGGKPPKGGDAWKFSFCRYDYSTYLAPSPEESASAPLRSQSFHRYEDYSTMKFAP